MNSQANWYQVICLVSLIGLAWACRRPSSEAKLTGPDLQKAGQLIRVNRAGWQLYRAPGFDQAVLATLPAGSWLKDLGEVSTIFSRLERQQHQYIEPWIRVQTAKGLSGWVFAAILRPEEGGSSAQADLLLTKRFQALFGRSGWHALRRYQRQWEQATSAAAVAQVYRRGQVLADSLARALRGRVSSGEVGQPTDLFWLGQMFPGFQPQLIAGGAAYQLFADYRQFWRLAQRSQDQTDDRFFALCIRHYPEDSIAYFHPVFFLETSDDGGSSLLGRGLHRTLLAALAQQWEESPLFHPELRAMKNALINDVAGTNHSFWETTANIVPELEEMLGAGWSILEPADLVALAVRLEQFKQPEQYGLHVDQQSGRN